MTGKPRWAQAAPLIDSKLSENCHDFATNRLLPVRWFWSPVCWPLVDWADVTPPAPNAPTASTSTRGSNNRVALFSSFVAAALPQGQCSAETAGFCGKVHP